MSKYIRTKNKVYEVESEYINNESKWIGYNIVGDDMALILKDQVIKQADTIEELCDEFVCYGNNSYSLLHRITKIDKYAVFKDRSAGRVEDLMKKGCVFYGAVWCEFGLKYVAKMNEKGVLELI